MNEKAAGGVPQCRKWVYAGGIAVGFLLSGGGGPKACLLRVKRGVACGISRNNVVDFVLYRMSI